MEPSAPYLPLKMTMEALNKKILQELQSIPGVGKSIANDLYGLGIRSINDLKNKNPEALYVAFCRQQGQHIDRCMLYVLRCAVYFASHKHHDPELLKWWNWKDASDKQPQK